ncbi:MAG TPA: hypothetical protein VFJ82_15910 [Longimicrobium sp.]|nr:hypothetical protein [Longimicrobium sp.]
MPKLTLDLEALQVESFTAATPEPRLMDAATANTCWRSCLATACFC